MNRLVVNPARPDTWEIELKPGVNRLGRGDANDFTIGDASVSGSHCQIVVNEGMATIQDLGSTNGTFINGTQIQNARLENGQTIRLGGVEMIFYSAPEPTAVSPAAPRMRVSVIPNAPTAVATVLGGVPPTIDLTPGIQAAPSVCKFHPRSPARWFCSQCNRSFCDLCVASHNAGGAVKTTCRTCAVECAPLDVKITRPVEIGFLARLPGAILYPFRGTGILVLIVGTLVFAGLNIISAGLFSILMKIVALGYLFSYMQNIIFAAAAEEKEMPELPGMDDVFGGFCRLAGTVLMSFGMAIGLLAARFFNVDVPLSAIFITGIFGVLYFPLAFLAVAMKDNVMAANPLVVVPSILRVPLQYLVTVFVFVSIFGVQQIGNLVAAGSQSVTFSTPDMTVMFIAIGFQMIWSFISVYLLTVNSHILGLLYVTQKEKLGW
jgi:hypothetical protein